MIKRIIFLCMIFNLQIFSSEKNNTVSKKFLNVSSKVLFASSFIIPFVLLHLKLQAKFTYYASGGVDFFYEPRSILLNSKNKEIPLFLEYLDKKNMTCYNDFKSVITILFIFSNVTLHYLFFYLNKKIHNYLNKIIFNSLNKIICNGLNKTVLNIYRNNSVNNSYFNLETIGKCVKFASFGLVAAIPFYIYSLFAPYINKHLQEVFGLKRKFIASIEKDFTLQEKEELIFSLSGLDKNHFEKNSDKAKLFSFFIENENSFIQAIKEYKETLIKNIKQKKEEKDCLVCYRSIDDIKLDIQDTSKVDRDNDIKNRVNDSILLLCCSAQYYCIEEKYNYCNSEKYFDSRKKHLIKKFDNNSFGTKNHMFVCKECFSKNKIKNCVYTCPVKDACLKISLFYNRGSIVQALEEQKDKFFY